MKRKINITIAISIAVILILAGIGLFIYNKNSTDITSNRYLTEKEEKKSFISYTNQKYSKDTMSFGFIGFTGKWSFFELDTKKGNKITIKDNSKIDEGEFYIVVLDPNYKNVLMKKANEKKAMEFVAEEEGKYLIRIVGKEASGYFDIKITSEGDLKTSYRDFLR